MEAVRILIVSSEYPPGPGGIGFHAYSLASALHREGCRVAVLCNADYAEPALVKEFDVGEPYPIRRFGRRKGLTVLMRCRDLSRSISDFRPKHVIVTGRFPIWMMPLMLINRVRPVRHVIIHGHETIMGSSFARRLTSFTLRFCNILYPVSHFSAGNLPQRIVQRRPVHVIPNGIDLHALSRYPTDDVHGRLEGSPVLLTVGHTSPRKGQHRVIRALPALRRKFPDARYHMIGRDINNKGLEALARELGVHDMIRFHTPVFPHENLGLYYSSADVFMLLSENQPNGDVEGFGIVALEANYFGTPVVGAKDCGVEDAVSHGNSGCLVDGDDAEEITDAVEFLMEHKETREVAKNNDRQDETWLGQTRQVCASWWWCHTLPTRQVLTGIP
ncbi:MAG: glycosyltransferase family 1 protein [Chitinophagia bacterium]|nr:glycosyltransferase family 1 protein [Chitinophagia bacterium]